MNTEDIRTRVLQAVQIAEANDMHVPTKGQMGAVIGVLNRVCGGDENRRLLMGWLFAPSKDMFSLISTKTLTDEQWSALYGWCDFRKDEERNIWVPRPEFMHECLACLSSAMADYQRIKMQDRDLVAAPPELVSIATSMGGVITEVDGKKGAGVRVEDALFDRERPLAIAPSPPPESAPQDRPALREPFKAKPPKLYNPF